MAETPQQTIRELRELIVAYAKQETIDPLKGLGRYVGYGIGGALAMGIGFLFLEVGALRLLQGWGPNGQGRHFTGSSSWAPYFIVLAGSLVVAVAVWIARGKRKSRSRRKQ